MDWQTFFDGAFSAYPIFARGRFEYLGAEIVVGHDDLYCVLEDETPFDEWGTGWFLDFGGGYVLRPRTREDGSKGWVIYKHDSTGGDCYADKYQDERYEHRGCVGFVDYLGDFHKFVLVAVPE